MPDLMCEEKEDEEEEDKENWGKEKE